MLSIIDLLNDGTLSLELSSHVIKLIISGVSIATGALIGGVGKTTLLASFLAFLPPGSRIITVTESTLVKTPFANHVKGHNFYLCHEISPAHYYSYLWKHNLKPYFSLARYPRSHIVFTIHANTLDEMYPQIVNRDSGLTDADFSLLDLLVFINTFHTTSGLKRRVTALFEKSLAGSKHSCTYRYDQTTDTIIPAHGDRDPDEIEQKISAIIKELARDNIRYIEEVREAFFTRYSQIFPI